MRRKCSCFHLLCHVRQKQKDYKQVFHIYLRSKHFVCWPNEWIQPLFHKNYLLFIAGIFWINILCFVIYAWFFNISVKWIRFIHHRTGRYFRIVWFNENFFFQTIQKSFLFDPINLQTWTNRAENVSIEFLSRNMNEKVICAEYTNESGLMVNHHMISNWETFDPVKRSFSFDMDLKITFTSNFQSI